MIGPAKRALFSAILVLVVLAGVEIALRGYFASVMGPSAFWYGTSFHRLDIAAPPESATFARTLHKRRLRGSDDEFHNVRQHEFVAGNYTKYFPQEVRYTYDADTGEVYRATINGIGFRGDAPAESKAPGTVRVVTLGASSTFGYHNPDDGTYPAILEDVLNERCSDGTRYEVINLGIPHLTSAEIVSLFLAEAVPLHPDVVTFYEGINDSADDGESAAETATRARSATSIVKQWFREHFVLPLLIHEIGDKREKRYDPAQVEATAKGRPEQFVENLARLRDECSRRGIQFVVGKQQARSLLIPRENIKGVTYADEVARVREKLAREGHVNWQEINFLVHDRILAAQESWARDNAVPVADIVAALDRDRDVLVSWVHLNPRGNAMVAETYAREILNLTCRAGGDGLQASPPAALQPRG